jgi:hypothetical protein
MAYLPSELSQKVELLTSVREILDSTLCWETDYPDIFVVFLSESKQISGCYI